MNAGMNADQRALAWLALLLIASAIYLARLIRRGDYDWWETCLYLPTYLLGRLLWRVYFTNDAPEALRRGAILVANHRSSVDPFFVQLAARRRVHWMVAREYCQHPAFGPLLRLLQVIPTNRSGMDTAATKIAMRLTRDGRLVGMFPEGKLNHTPRPLLPLRAGAALVAIRSQVPIIPLLIEGSPRASSVWRPLFMPARVAITFGQPILPPSVVAPPPSDPALDGVVAGTSTIDAPTADGAPSERRPTGELTEPERLILLWAQQIVAMAGRPDAPIELASQRKRHASRKELPA